MFSFTRASMGGVILLGAGVITFVACGDDSAGPAPGKACVDTAGCDDAQPCTVDACVDGLCVNQPMPDGDALEQVDGDCARVVCAGGVATVVPDDGDARDDHEVCTLDMCEAGATRHVELVDGHPCTDGLGSGGCVRGECEVDCTPSTADTVCDDLNPCSQDSCGADGICDHVDVPDGVLDEEQQVEGDCHELHCSSGAPLDRIDDEDLPEDDDLCTADQCSDGVPSNVEFACTLPEWCGGGGDPNACGCSASSESEAMSPLAADQYAIVGTEAWDSPTGVLESGDDLFASISYMAPGDVSTYLVATQFEFAIPDHATIDGIEVEWQRGATTGEGLVDHAVRIVKAGLVGAEDRSSTEMWPAASTPVYAAYGGPSDAWGETWTPADINSPLFGAALAVEHGGESSVDSPQVDHVQITVTFSVACQ